MRVRAKDITYETVADLYRYAPDTGELFRKLDDGDSLVTTKHSGGYLQVSILGTTIPAHRIAWMLQTGKWPSGVIDHINRNKMDNRWENLRDTDRRTNALNSDYWEGYKPTAKLPKWRKHPIQLELDLR